MTPHRLEKGWTRGCKGEGEKLTRFGQGGEGGGVKRGRLGKDWDFMCVFGMLTPPPPIWESPE